jgi:TPR repeat protein
MSSSVDSQEQILEKALELYNVPDVEENLAKAIDAFLLIADTDKTAAYYLGYIYSGENEWNDWNLDDNQKKYFDVDKAVHWFKRSAELGDEEGQYRYALCCLNATGRKKDVDEAFKWAQLSADQETQYGQMLLASMYKNGVGTQKNRKKAIELLEKATNPKQTGPASEACVCLAEIYFEDGQECELYRPENAQANYRLCYEWATKGDKLGPVYGANYYLATLFLKGLGVAKDLIAAKKHTDLSVKYEENGGYYIQSRFEMAADNVVQSKIFLEEATKKDNFPEYWRACIDLGATYLTEEKPALALIYFYKAKSPERGLAEYVISRQFAAINDTASELNWLFISAREGFIQAGDAIIDKMKDYSMNLDEWRHTARFADDFASNQEADNIRDFVHKQMNEQLQQIIDQQKDHYDAEAKGTRLS